MSGMLRTLLVTLLGAVSLSAAANNTLAELNQIEANKTRVRTPVQSNSVDQFKQENRASRASNPEDNDIMALAQNYSLIVFYLSTCPHCHHFLPVLKEFASLSHIPLIAYTLDGNKIQGFPHTQIPSHTLVQKLFPGGASVPALFLINNHNGHLFEVAIGEQSPRQLLIRLRRLAPKVLAYDQQGEG